MTVPYLHRCAGSAKIIVKAKFRLPLIERGKISPAISVQLIQTTKETRQGFDGMTPNLQMEHLSLTYVRAVATIAGLQVTRPEPDFDSVDGVISSITGRRPKIEFQAKSTTQNMLRNGSIYFPLSIKNYNDLRAETISPRVLVVLLMPRDSHDWIAQSEEELCLRYCAYWLCLEAYPNTTNSRSVTVEVPTANILNVDQLTSMMRRVERGESL